MKRIILLTLVTIMLVVPFENIAFAQTTEENEVILDNEGLVLSQDEALPIAPEAFYITDNTIYITNRINDSISVFQDGKSVDTISLAATQSIIDISIIDNKFFLLDNESNLMIMGQDGKIDMSLNYSNAINENVAESSQDSYDIENPYDNPALLIKNNGDSTSLLYLDSSERIIENSSDQGISNNKVADLGFPYQYTFMENGFTAVDENTGSEFISVCRYEPVEMSELARDDSFIYFYICDADYANNNGTQYHRYVYKYAYDGELKSVYYLEDAFEYVPNRQLCVDNGNVYQMLIKKDSVEIIKLAQKKPLSANDNGFELVADQSLNAPTNSEINDVLLKGVRLANLEWTYSKTKNGDISVVPKNVRKYVTQPSYLEGVTGTTFRGYPYCWGGYDSESTSSNKGWSNFKNGLSKNKYAGNIRSDKNVPKELRGHKGNTIGLDCSGMVSAIYSLGKKYGTSGLIGSASKYPFKKSTSKPIKGDIYNKSGSHVVAVCDRRQENGKWVIVVVESTTVGLDKVVHRTRNESSFKSGYVTGKLKKWYS